MVAHANRKEKGAILERKVVDRLQEAGFAAERIAFQAGNGVGLQDVSVPLCGVDRLVQCKHWKVGFEPVYRALEKADIAVVQGHHKKPVVCVPLDTWLEHIKLAESYRAPPISEAAE